MADIVSKLNETFGMEMWQNEIVSITDSYVVVRIVAAIDNGKERRTVVRTGMCPVEDGDEKAFKSAFDRFGLGDK